ncbi:low-specificity L-threonine aldolase [Candidatus Chlorohelix sp.]|uniref:low-specificity L-threonine aldolase n=1 Tax=Candidatus Chlorohelix sp. TaxID=3139201 RepID=UPI00303AD5A5
MARIIDLRSDTVTKPTSAMREAMYKAEVGDDVYGEDPTVNKLEETAAEIMGKEAGLFVTSGTMGNLIGVITHCSRGQEIIMGAESHIFYYEVGGGAIVGGLMYHTVQENRLGILNLEQIAHAIRGKNIHYPVTGLVCLENSHNRKGGTVMSIEDTKRICDTAHANDVPVHLDGARVFNAATYLGKNVRELVAEIDSVQLCLSKGLGAPVGSVLVGKRDFIERARKNRKMLGGGMRQAGILAAAGLISLTEMTKRLGKDHYNAQRLAEGLQQVRGLEIDLETVQTNIVMADTTGSGRTADEWVTSLKQKGILINSMGPYTIRFVTHYEVEQSGIDEALTVISSFL